MPARRATTFILASVLIFALSAADRTRGEGQQSSLAAIDPGGAGAIGTQTAEGTSGRFIQIEKASGTIHTSEIEAFLGGVTPSSTTMLDNANDQALTGLGAMFTTVSGGGGHGADSAAINGFLDTGAATYTRSGTPMIGRADLGSTKSIGLIRTWQRADACCPERLEDFTVSLLADDGTGNPGTTVFSEFFSGQAPSPYAEFTLPDEFTIGSGDTLRIEFNGNSADLLSVGAAGDGTLNIEPGATLELVGLGGEPTEVLDILDFGTVNGSFSNIIDPVGFNFDNLLITGELGAPEIPEPSTFALFSVILGGMLVGRRWWRRSAC